MMSTDVELRQQLKEAGKLLSRPPDSVDELLHNLDQVEKLLLLVDQSPTESMQEALKPTMTALVKESLLRHSNVDVKVAVASCISEITRITAPEAPYNDEEMKDVFELIVSSFENLSDKSSRSYDKRASILETVSKVRSCVIMLDLECDRLIVDMFEHFLKSVRDHHSESVFSSMMSIMVLVFEESEDIPVIMLKPLLASIKKNNEGVLPIARKLSEGVLQKSANKLRPYLIPTLRALGDSLDSYSQVLASICEEPTAVIEHNDKNALVQQKVVMEKTGPKSPKSVMSNGTLVIANEEASTDHDSPKKTEEAINHQDPNLTSKVDPNDSTTEKLEIKPEPTSKKIEKTSDKESSVEAGIPSETKKNTSIPISVPEGTESEVPNALPNESSDKNAGLTKANNVLLPQEQEVNGANNSSLAQNGSIIYESRIKKSSRTKKNNFSKDFVFPTQKRVRKKAPVAQEDAEVTSGSDVELLKTKDKNVGSLDSRTKSSKQLSGKGKKDKVGVEEPDAKKAKQLYKKTDDRELEAKMLKQAGKKEEESESVAKPIRESGKRGEKSGLLVNPNKEGVDLDTKPLDSGAKLSEQLSNKGKKDKVGAEDPDKKKAKQSDKKPVDGELKAKKLKWVFKKQEESDSDAKPTKESGKKGQKRGYTSNQEERGDFYTKPLDSGEKLSKPSSSKGKKDKVGTEDPEMKKIKWAGKKEDERDSDAKPIIKQSCKKGEKSRVIVNPTSSGHIANKEVGDDLDAKPLKLSAKKGNTGGSGYLVNYSSKKGKDGKKKGHGNNLEEKDQAKSLFVRDGMDVSPKSAKGEDNLDEALLNTSKRKRSMGKDKVTETIKYDDSLVGLKVKVWWPKDKTYYEGAIQSFDSTKQKHKVVYLDGDTEILNLRKEKWQIIQDFSVYVDEKVSEVQSGDDFVETHKKKKARKDSGVSDSQEKSKKSAKRSGRGSVVKGKDDKKPKDVDVLKPEEAGTSKEDDDPNVKDLEGLKTPESAKVGSKSGHKRKMRG